METQNSQITKVPNPGGKKDFSAPPQNLPVMEIKTMEKDLEMSEKPGIGPKVTAQPAPVAARPIPSPPPPVYSGMSAPALPSPPKKSPPAVTSFGLPQIKADVIKKEPAPIIEPSRPVIRKESPQPTPVQKEKQELETFFAEGVSLYQKNFYPEAAEQLARVVNSPRASFFLRFKAKGALKKAQKKISVQKMPPAAVSPKPLSSSLVIEPPTPRPTLPASPQPFPATKPPQRAPFEEEEKKGFAPSAAPTTRQTSLDWSKIIFALSLVVLVVGIAAAAIFYFQGKSNQTTPPPAKNPSVVPASPPKKLISGQFEETLNYTDKEELRQSLKSALAKEIREGYFKNIFIKKVVDVKESYLTLDEFLAGFGNSMPQDVRANLADDYNLLVYQQKQGDQASPFQEQDFTANKRLLLVVSIKDKEQLQKALLSWEKTLVNDLPVLFLDKNIGQPQTESFQENFYRGTLVKYQNFSDPSLSLDYVIVDGLLLITTSRESAFASLDRMLEKL